MIAGVNRVRLTKPSTGIHELQVGAPTGSKPDADSKTLIARIGCAGWNIPRPAAASFQLEGTHLERYSRVFNCCEINSSFYRSHKDSTWERWAAAVPEQFQFSVKIPRTITHEAKLKCNPGDLRDFLKQVNFLGQKLGALLIQLPPSFGFDSATATSFFALLRNLHDGDVVLEARNETWFSTIAADLLTNFKIAGVAADPACIPAASHPSGYGQVVYFRLHGSPRRYYSPYGSEFLKAKASEMTRLSRKSQAWCIFDNTAAGSATTDALQLKKYFIKASLKD